MNYDLSGLVHGAASEKPNGPSAAGMGSSSTSLLNVNKGGMEKIVYGESRRSLSDNKGKSKMDPSPSIIASPARASPNIGNDVRGSPPLGAASHGGGAAFSSSPPKRSSVDPNRSWSQVVQGQRRFRWESIKTSDAEIAQLEQKFFSIIHFSEEDIQPSAQRLRSVLIG